MQSEECGGSFSIFGNISVTERYKKKIQRLKLSCNVEIILSHVRLFLCSTHFGIPTINRCLYKKLHVILFCHSFAPSSWTNSTDFFECAPNQIGTIVRSNIVAAVVVVVSFPGYSGSIIMTTLVYFIAVAVRRCRSDVGRPSRNRRVTVE